MLKISKRYERMVFIFLMVLGMTFFISLCLLWMNFGLVPGFFWLWMKNWFHVFLVAFPVALVIVPGVQAIVKRLVVEETKEEQLNG